MAALLLLFYSALAHACSWDRSVGLWQVKSEQTVWEAATYLSGSEDDVVRIRELKDVIVDKNPDLQKPVYIVEGQVFTVPYSSVISPASWQTYTSYGCTPYLEFPGQGRTDHHVAIPTPYSSQGTSERSECACACSKGPTVVVAPSLSTTGNPSQPSSPTSWTSVLDSRSATISNTYVTSTPTTVQAAGSRCRCRG